MMILIVMATTQSAPAMGTCATPSTAAPPGPPPAPPPPRSIRSPDWLTQNYTHVRLVETKQYSSLIG